MDNFLHHAHKFCLDKVPQYYTRFLLCMGMLGHPLYWCVSSARPTAIFETFVAPERFGQPTGMCITRGGRQIGRIPSPLLVAVLVKLQCFHSKAVLCMQSIILQSNAMSSPRFFTPENCRVNRDKLLSTIICEEKKYSFFSRESNRNA